MPDFEILLYIGLGASILIGGLMMGIALRESRPTDAGRALDEGRFRDALALSETGPKATERDLRVAAIAAKHCGDWDSADLFLDRLLDDDREDAEALLEKGLVLIYRGDPATAIESLDRALALRSDLAESISLHRSYALMGLGETDRARRLFEEIEVPLETKLRSDMGAGEPIFCEWFIHAASLWSLAGDWQRASWAREEAMKSAGDSRLPDTALDPARSRPTVAGSEDGPSADEPPEGMNGDDRLG